MKKALTVAAQAADIGLQPKAVVRPGLEIPVISVFGDLRRGDAEKFLQMTAELRDAIILLNSDGAATL